MPLADAERRDERVAAARAWGGDAREVAFSQSAWFGFIGVSRNAKTSTLAKVAPGPTTSR